MSLSSELADLSDDLRPRVRDLIDAARAAGHDVGITSAWRSRAEQQRLYDGWKARRPGYNPANPPGMSRHEDTTPDGRPAANAVDLDYPNGSTARALAVAWVKKHARTFGLAFPIRREDWHAESNGKPYRPQEDDDMTPAQAKQLAEVHAMLKALVAPRLPDGKDRDKGHVDLGDILNRIEGR